MEWIVPYQRELSEFGTKFTVFKIDITIIKKPFFARLSKFRNFNSHSADGFSMAGMRNDYEIYDLARQFFVNFGENMLQLLESCGWLYVSINFGCVLFPPVRIYLAIFVVGGQHCDQLIFENAILKSLSTESDQVLLQKPNQMYRLELW